MRLYPKIITRFLANQFFKNFIGMLGLVIGITFIISLIENMTKSNSTLSESAIGSLVQIFEWFPIFLPLVVFIATLLTTWKLTRSSEIPIIVGAGLSPVQWMRPFIYVAFLIGLVASTLINPLSVRLSSYWEMNNSDDSHNMLLLDDKIWVREQNPNYKIILESKYANLKKDEMIFKDNIILFQDANFKLLNRIEAKEVVLSDGKWIAKNPIIYDTNNNILNPKTWETDSNMSPNHVYDRYLKSSQISFWKLPTFIRNLNETGFNTRSHKLQFYTLLFQPFLLIVMVILGISFSLTRQARNYSFGLKFGLGIFASFVLYFLTNVFVALGTSGFLPPIIAIMAPPLIILFFSMVYILNFDNK